MRVTVLRVLQVDDVLETKLERKFKLITDKGTLDAVGLHPDGAAHKYALFVVFFLEFSGFSSFDFKSLFPLFPVRIVIKEFQDIACYGS